MRLRTCNWLLLFFMLWLPIQSTVAAMLSVCAEEKSVSSRHVKALVTAGDDHHHANCHKQAAENPIDHVLSSITCDDTSCDAYSNTPIAPNSATSLPVKKAPAVFTLNPDLISFIPEQLQRPPL